MSPKTVKVKENDVPASLSALSALVSLTTNCFFFFFSTSLLIKTKQILLLQVFDPAKPAGPDRVPSNNDMTSSFAVRKSLFLIFWQYLVVFFFWFFVFVFLCFWSFELQEIEMQWRPQGVLMTQLCFHTQPVTSLAVAYDNSFFTSASDDGTIKVRNILFFYKKKYIFNFNFYFVGCCFQFWTSESTLKRDSNRAPVLDHKMDSRITAMAVGVNNHIVACASSKVKFYFKKKKWTQQCRQQQEQKRETDKPKIDCEYQGSVQVFHVEESREAKPVNGNAKAPPVSCSTPYLFFCFVLVFILNQTWNILCHSQVSLHFDGVAKWTLVRKVASCPFRLLRHKFFYLLHIETNYERGIFVQSKSNQKAYLEVMRPLICNLLQVRCFSCSSLPTTTHGLCSGLFFFFFFCSSWFVLFQFLKIDVVVIYLPSPLQHMLFDPSGNWILLGTNLGYLTIYDMRYQVWSLFIFIDYSNNYELWTDCQQSLAPSYTVSNQPACSFYLGPKHVRGTVSSNFRYFIV